MNYLRMVGELDTYDIPTVTIVSLLKRRTGFLKVITSVDAQFSVQIQMKSKKSHHVRSYLIFRPKYSEKQKKGIASADRSLS